MPNKAQSVSTLSTDGTNGKEWHPGRALYVAVRTGLTSKETSLSAWCEANGVTRGKAQAALFGYSNSVEAKSIRARLMRAAGLIGEGEAP